MPQGDQVRNGKAFEYALANANQQDKFTNAFNYLANTILYKNSEYPFREVWFDEYDSNVLVSTVSLGSELFRPVRLKSFCFIIW